MEIKIDCAGYAIAADWYEGKDSARILIVLPGYTSSKAWQKSHAQAMVRDTGTSAIVVDFSGHGNSPFELRDTRPAQHFLELIYVFDWLKQSYPNAVLSVTASSYGGYLAAHLTQYRQFDNLVLRAPAIYRPTTFYDPWSMRIDNHSDYDEEITKYRRDRTSLAKHPFLISAAAFKGQVLVVVHENDGVVPGATTDAYINAFQADSQIAVGCSHTIDKNIIGADLFTSYQDNIAGWLNSR